MSGEIISRIQNLLSEQEIAALVVSSPDNVAYTAGFEVPSQVIPVSRHRLVFCVISPTDGDIMLVPDMEASLARSASLLSDVRDYNEFTADPVEVLADTLREMSATGSRIAIEDDFIPGEYFNRILSLLPNSTFEPARPLMSELRSIKNPPELDKLRRVGKIAEKAHFDAAEKARQGMTELDLASFIYESVFSQGADYVNWLVIGSGPRSEHGNANPTSRVLMAGDLVRMDIFAKVEAYQSDVARTAVVGKPSPEQQDIWNKLLEARDLVLEMIKPGAQTAAIYQRYADYFKKVGLDPINFVGHGLGVSLHEEPYISRYHDSTLEPGMVLAVEPLYLKDGMGYQVEDEVIVTEDGFELITDYITPPPLIEI